MSATSRITWAGLAAAALGVSFVAGMAVQGRGSGPAPGPAVPDPTDPVAIRLVNSDLRSPSSCDELLDWYIERGVARVTAYGWDNPMIYAYDLGGDMPTSRDGAAASAPSGTKAALSSATGTNVQEAGVDEPDLVKTDGELLVRVHDDDLTTYDVTGSRPDELAGITLPQMRGAEVLLAGDTVVAIGQDASDDPTWQDPTGLRDGMPEYAGSAQTRVLVLDVADPAAPKITDTYLFSSSMVEARQHGDVVRLVLSEGLPDLDFVQPRFWRSDEGALRRNQDIVRESTLDDWLPTVTTYDDPEATDGGSTEALVECGDVSIPDADAGLGTMSVVALDVAAPAERDVAAVATSSQIAYLSTERLYLASGIPSWGPIGGCCLEDAEPDAANGTTQLYAFALDGTSTTYVASGEVEGWIEDRWAMDEADGVLRVAVGPSSLTGNFNSVVTLGEDGDALVELGRVDRLGVNEQIKSVRWFDDLALVVTFRQTDPLYAIDLGTPDHPRLLGRLDIPGFSEYLHPLGPRRLIGMGQDASRSGVTRGAQAALFDLIDVSSPQRRDVVRYRPGSIAQAGMEPRQFTWLPDQRTALTVVSQGWEGQTGWVSVLTVRGNTLENRMRAVEYGTEISQVRLVPLPSGKVVLVTGDGVSFFPL